MNEALCCRCGEETATMNSPARFCDACWQEWWDAPKSENREWDALIEKCKEGVDSED